MEKSAPRIAVIAVHGVADQQRNETARSIAAQLQSLGGEPLPSARGPEPPEELPPRARYSAFTETPLLVPVSPVRLKRSAAGAPEAKQGMKRKIRAGLYSSYAAEQFDRPDKPARLDYEFMLHQLEKYTGRDDPPSYETVLVSGERKHDAGPEARIDVYEVYWADLSRLGKGLLRILGEFYQLLFHLSSLGKTTVDLARMSCKGASALRSLALFQSLASWLLVLPIAILNLYLVLLAAGLVLVTVPPAYKLVALTCIGGTAAAILVARWIVYRRWQIGFRGWAIGQLLGFVLGAAGAYWLAAKLAFGTYPMLTVLWVLAAIGAADVLAAHYELRRRGARAVSALCGAAILAVTLLFFGGAPDGPDGIVLLIGRVSEIVFAALVLLWALLIAFHLVAWVLGEIAAAQARGAGSAQGNLRDELWQVERAVWTGRMGLFIPASAFLILTLSLWLAVLDSVKNALSDFYYEPYVGFLVPGRVGAAEFIEKLVDQSAGRSFDLFLGLSALALAMLLWGFFPAVIAEIAPPRSPLGVDSRRIGHWLDHGFRLARWAGRVALLAAFVVLPAGFALAEFYPAVGAYLTGDHALKSIGSILAGSAVGIIALGSQLGKVFLGFRAGLDVALDVDNWLRERPREANARARICARYASLLRHVCEFRDERGRGYDALVIVAHSQGTVISADLLRFLGDSPDPQLAALGKELPVYLLTLGCPLRQLYGLRFPHLYEWATHDGAVGMPQNGPYQYGLIPAFQYPDPKELRVQLWVNAFCSGDYVGRHLWLRDDHKDRWQPATPDGSYIANDSLASQGKLAGVSRVELCIGAGAHTHYFDETAPRIAQILDQLIGVAIAGQGNYRVRFPVFRPGT